MDCLNSSYEGINLSHRQTKTRTRKKFEKSKIMKK